MATNENELIMTRYYTPNADLVDYLKKELQSQVESEKSTGAGEGIKYKFKRKGTKKQRDRIAHDKNYYFQTIFQKLIDVTYFLEFIEDHPELHELYEDSLKQLFGFTTKYELTEKQWNMPYGSRDRGLFFRFVRTCLFWNRYHYTKMNINFRVQLANWLVEVATDAIEKMIMSPYDKNNEFRFYSELQEQELYKQNVSTAKLHSSVIARKYDRTKEKPSRHRIGYFGLNKTEFVS